MRKAQAWIVIVGAAALGSAATFLVTRVDAAGIPTTGALTYTGLLQNPDGTPVAGSKNIGLTIWSAQAAGSQVCTVPSAAIVLNGGRFQLALPDACQTGVNANPNLWAELSVDGSSLGRTKLGAVPYAVQAGHATTADSLTSATDPARDAQWMLLHAAAAGACLGSTPQNTGNGSSVVPKSTSTCAQQCAALGSGYTCSSAVAVSNILTTRVGSAAQPVASHYNYSCDSPFSSGESPAASPSVSGVYVYCCCNSA